MKKQHNLDEARLSRFQPQSATHTPKVIVFRILIVCEGIKTEPNYFRAIGKKKNSVSFEKIGIHIPCNTPLFMKKEYLLILSIFEKRNLLI